MPDMRPHLVWSPTHSHVAASIDASKSPPVIFIAPFVKERPLRTLLDRCRDTTDLKIIARWSGPDLVMGASDISVYPMLLEQGIPLYIHPSIHLKLFIFGDGNAFHTSGNITARGLGLTDNSNIEVGCDVALTRHDWKKVYAVLEGSTRVDSSIYEAAALYIANHKEAATTLPPLTLLSSVQRAFSILSLPASVNPEALYSYYAAADSDPQLDCEHDLVLYSMPEALTRDPFLSNLSEAFTRHPFTRALVEWLRHEETARFGRVTEWVHSMCSDSPAPYRADVKTSVRRLYDWLSYFYPEISWDQPRHSMVLRWSEAAGPSRPG